MRYINMIIVKAIIILTVGAFLNYITRNYN